MIRGVILTFTTCLLALSLFGGIAEAHVLKVDGNIGIELHIEPDDNPATGRPTIYDLSFTDVSGRFSLVRCNCRVAVKTANKTIYTHDLRVTNPSQSTNDYTFPKPGVYDLDFSGQPIIASNFQQFNISYQVQVSDGSHITSQNFPALLWVGIAMIVGLLVIAAFATDQTGTDQPPSPHARKA